MQNKQPRLQIFFPQQKKREYQNTHTHTLTQTSHIRTHTKQNKFNPKTEKAGVCRQVAITDWDFGPQRGKTKPELRGRIETIW